MSPPAPARLVLASSSPQRRAILEQIGAEFTVSVSGAEEVMSGPPEEVVLENAYRKASTVWTASGRPGAGTAVLGVDTIVALGPRIYGKPADESAARATLAALSGRGHVVLSGICLITGETVRSAAARTEVRFRRLTAAEIDAHLAHGEWRGRAGGYAIQGRGALLVERIEGDYLNIVGLPVGALLDLAPWLLEG